MRGALVGAWTSVAAASSLVALVIACGTQLAAPPEDDAGTAIDATEPAEEPLEEFRCGAAAYCKVNVQVCCLSGGDPTCALAGDGCTAVAADAGGDAEAGPPSQPLRCTTYRVCYGTLGVGSDCCWSASRGSECKSDCEADEMRLCQEGDGCGYGASCEPIPDDPLGPGVWRCVPDGTSGSSNGGSSWGGGGGSSWGGP